MWSLRALSFAPTVFSQGVDSGTLITVVKPTKWEGGRSLVITLVHCGDDAVTFLDGIGHPPGESRFALQPFRGGVLSYFNRVGFFQPG